MPLCSTDKAVMKCGQALQEGTADLIRKVITDGGSTAQFEDMGEEYMKELEAAKRQRLGRIPIYFIV
jgi:hypothetical protein